MKTQINEMSLSIFLLSLLCSPIITPQLFAQATKIFSDRSVHKVHAMKGTLDSGEGVARTKNNKFAIIVYEPADGGRRVGNLSIYEPDGDLRLEKQIENLVAVGLAESSDKFIVRTSKYGEHDTNICFDDQGKELWQVQLPSPGFRLSKYGDYAIVPHSYNEASRIRLRILNADTGADIDLQIQKPYSSFEATYLDSVTALVFLQNTLIEHDLSVVEARRKAGLPTKRPRGKSQLDKWSFTHQPIRLIAYDLETSSPIYERELNSSEGDTLLLYDRGGLAGNTLVSDDHNQATILLFNTRKKKKVLVQLDRSGDRIWESIIETKEAINGLYYVSQSQILINYRSSSFELINASTGNREWITPKGNDASAIVRGLSVSDNVLTIATSDPSYNKSRLFELNLKSGDVISSKANPPGMVTVMHARDRSTVVDRNENKIKYYYK